MSGDDLEGPLRALVEQRALERLTERYADATDRREPDLVASLFTEDGLLTLSMDGASGQRARRYQGRAAIAAEIAALNRFDATTHFLGQRSFEVDGQQARGQTYCLAYHVRKQAGRQVNLVLSIRYIDKCVRRDGQWLFRERAIVTDWTDRYDHVPNARLPGGAPMHKRGEESFGLDIAGDNVLVRPDGYLG